MLTHFKCNLRHFKNTKGIYMNSLIQKYNILMITIWRTSLYAFWNREPSTVRGNIAITRKMGMVIPRKS